MGNPTWTPACFAIWPNAQSSCNHPTAKKRWPCSGQRFRDAFTVRGGSLNPQFGKQRGLDHPAPFLLPASWNYATNCELVRGFVCMDA